MPGAIESLDVIGSASIPDIESIENKTFYLPELIKSLPDLYTELANINIRSNLIRGKMKARATFEANSSRYTEITDFFLDGMFPEEKIRILAYFASKNSDIKTVVDLQTNAHLRLSKIIDPENKDPYFLPDVVQNREGSLFYIIDPDTFLPEPCSILMILFCLGMFCRYYPDIWVHTLDSDPWLKDFLNIALDEFIVKFPLLILDQLTLKKHVLS